MKKIDEQEDRALDFIRQIISEDLKTGKHQKTVTRFPPEPNGFLHIGHAKSICLNFGIKVENNGACNLRFDDTNPSKEEITYVESIKEDVKWLGYDWGESPCFASDYFPQLYEFAVTLIKKGKAYVCQLSPEQIREYRGTLTEPGRESPYRNQTPEKNIDLFEKMKKGEFEEGSHVLRLKIDMASPNLNMRDPVIYRILNTEHHRTGDTWKIYPMYDYTHCLSDMLENITHSLCTLEFEDHRPLYDWILDTLDTPCHPRQIEFARLNLSYTVMSKRKIMQLVEGHYVDGWDDPRMITLSGLRRRGYTPSSIRSFISAIGVGKKESWIDMTVLENSVRDDLNSSAPRKMCVLNPVKVILDNFPEGQVDQMEAKNHPQKAEMGQRLIPFTKELYIERNDFMEAPPRKFHRLGPGREVRLRYGYLIQYVSHTTDIRTGEIAEIHCTYDPQTRGGSTPDGRQVKGTIHWVSADNSIPVTVRLYDRLFKVESPEADKQTHFTEHINPDSKITLNNAVAEPSIAELRPGDNVQFERQGYFCVDPVESTQGVPVFNRTITLRDSWTKKN